MAPYLRCGTLNSTKTESTLGRRFFERAIETFLGEPNKKNKKKFKVSE
jgi:hypothetical protein